MDWTTASIQKFRAKIWKHRQDTTHNKNSKYTGISCCKKYQMQYMLQMKKKNYTEV